MDEKKDYKCIFKYASISHEFHVWFEADTQEIAEQLAKQYAERNGIKFLRVED